MTTWDINNFGPFNSDVWGTVSELTPELKGILHDVKIFSIPEWENG